MRDFRQLKVWQRSHALVLTIYKLTNTFPASEQYGLTSQMRRSSASIPTNLAEGCGRRTERELAQFSQIAMGSASELEYQLLLAHDLEYLSAEQYRVTNTELIEIKKMLNRFIATLRRA